MKRVIFYGLLSVLVLSCSTLFRFTPYHDKPAENLEYYIKQIPFKTSAIAGFQRPNGVFEKAREKITHGTVVGFCSVHIFPPTVQVSINPDYWYRVNHKQKMALLIHEFLHCDYAVMHDNRMLDKECPYSLMYSTTLPAHCLELHWDHYIEEAKEKTK